MNLPKCPQINFSRVMKIKIVLKTLAAMLGGLLLFLGLMWGGQAIYALCDRTVFPETFHLPENAGKLSDTEKGALLADAITWEMRRELKSTFGWSFNDIIFNRWLLDNRAYRQYGVYHATKFLVDLYSTQIAKLGDSDRENEYLYKARINDFVIDPRSFWFPSAEGRYEDGLKLFDKYKEGLKKGTSTYNCRTDDLYASFAQVTGENLLGYALGLLENAQDIPFYELDNRIYVVQGICLVIRDFVSALYGLYPEIGVKSQESMKAAIFYLDKICNYNPLYITSWFNSGELVTSWLLFARARLVDVQNSIRM